MSLSLRHGGHSLRARASRGVASAAIGIALAALTAPAHAGVSAQDGYGPGGAYQVHVELDFYGWLPATGATINLGNGAQKNISEGIPSVSELTNVLDGAFMGAALVRYGPWSAVLNVDWVSISQANGLAPDALGLPRSLKTSTSLVRVAPGFGYQIYNGIVGQLPTTLDGQAGFAWFGSDATLDLDRAGPAGAQRVSSLSFNGTFVQPWLGVRGAIYPGPRWRLALGAMVQGFGVGGGGSWGWGTDFTTTWAATNWLNLFAGFHALASGRDFSDSEKVSSLRVVAFGPLVGLGFSF
jgi:hypothetical protein